MENGQHNLDGRLLLLRVHLDRDASTVIDNCYRVVGVDRYLDRAAVARERLVDGVVDDLVDEMVKAAYAG
ncbi:unannotated protein [freshwater metagenome]|uniref:Unannotated protein n=1 Tax=freshwater metagenome TaxID=449393 RepID=A0A6J7RWK7_9ZZZZ